jgi:hypothetical protein
MDEPSNTPESAHRFVVLWTIRRRRTSCERQNVLPTEGSWVSAARQTAVARGSLNESFPSRGEPSPVTMGGGPPAPPLGTGLGVRAVESPAGEGSAEVRRSCGDRLASRFPPGKLSPNRVSQLRNSLAGTRGEQACGSMSSEPSPAKRGRLR